MPIDADLADQSAASAVNTGPPCEVIDGGRAVAAATKIYLDGTYIHRNPTYHTEDSAWKTQQIISMIKKHDLRFTSVCEIGCGAGEVLREMCLRFPQSVFHGYDISPHALALCRAKESDRLHFHSEDLLSDETVQFDLLLCIDVFEHVESYFDFLRRLRTRSVYKLFHIPLDMSVQSVLRRTPILKNRRKVGHIHYFMKDTALLTLQDCGYEIVDWRYTPSLLDKARSLKGRLARVPRKMLAMVNPDVAARVLGGYSLLVLAR
jgi:SAM-dependent methyltransferase